MRQESSGGTQAVNAAGTGAASATASVPLETGGPIPADFLEAVTGAAMGAATSGASNGRKAAAMGGTGATKSGCMPESRCSSAAAAISDGAWRRVVVVYS